MNNKIVYFNPKPEDTNFISKIYKKREFHLYKIPLRGEIKNYTQLSELREQSCKKSSSDFQLQPQQKFLSNFINPDTPYRGVLIFHGTGVGKTCAAIQIAEKFKDQVDKYNTKIYIVVSGPALEQNFKDELMGNCTGDTYITKTDDASIPDNELKKGKALVYQYYEIITYKKLLRKVLGEKIRSQSKEYIRDESGKVIREKSSNQINELSNTIIIVDEAHNISGNDYGQALKRIVHNKNSKNLKLVLLTATPMRNSAVDIVFLINLLRPKDNQLIADNIFEVNKNNTYDVKIKPNSLPYFKKMVSGYISYLRGADPVTFAYRNELGTVDKQFQFIKLIRCKMHGLQYITYKALAEKFKNDPLQQTVLAASNIVLPDIGKHSQLVPRTGNSGIFKLITSIHTNLTNIIDRLKIDLKKISSKIKVTSNFLSIYNNKVISGDIFKLENLKYFSVKYYEALKNINDCVTGKNGVGTNFVYSRFIGAGIHIFESVLRENGYIDYYNKDNITNFDNVKCYLCGVTKKEHSNSHIYHPATFVSITGEVDESGNNDEDINKRLIIKNVFNKENNSNGKYIKILIGSQVLMEGVSMMNVKNVHILEAQYTLTRIDQIIGRAIRYCSHINVMSEKYQYPVVNIYKYVVSNDNLSKLTIEEEMYRRAEIKYKTIKLVERAMKESAIDCPLNFHGNLSIEDIKKYKDCEKKGNCPAECDFMNCEFKCNDPELEKYWNNNEYSNLKLTDIDYSTFTTNLIQSEVRLCISYIKEMYRKDVAYTLEQILEYVKKKFPKYQRSLFDNGFVYEALSNLTPINENDFNNFKNIIYDKYNRECYLIQRDKYYIIQQFNESETVLIEDRKSYNKLDTRSLSLQNYINGKHPQVISDLKAGVNIYEYDNIYYNSRPEFDIVGIIIGKKNIYSKSDKITDLFNVRQKKDSTSIKLREKNVPTSFGANCLSKTKPELNEILKILEINTKSNNKNTICVLIKNKLLDLEKNSTGSNKKTYIKIPKNHNSYLFPYNIEDRIDYLKSKLKYLFTESQHIEITIVKNKLILESAKVYDEQHTQLLNMGAIFKSNKYYFQIS